MDRSQSFGRDDFAVYSHGRPFRSEATCARVLAYVSRIRSLTCCRSSEDQLWAPRDERSSRAARSLRVNSPEQTQSISGRDETAGAFRTVPSTAKCDPWHGQSQHRSREFQCTWQPTCEHVADRLCSVPSSLRNAAILVIPSRTIAPSPGRSRSTESISPARHTRRNS
jgi:hypothetical protein